MTETNNIIRRRISILIDGDNAQAKLLPQMLAETSKYGQVTIRRIYGDWTTASMNSWKKVLNNHAVQPVQQFRYTIGKNATDSAMIIDAMDILHSDNVNGFCLVSSDSDYTRLATRIREAGVFVMGIGEKKTPRPFVNACDLFVFTENLAPKRKPAPRTKTTSSSKQQKTTKKPAAAPEPIPLLKQAFEIAVREDGWASMAMLGNALYQVDPSFDPRSYGHGQLSRLIGKYKEYFELRTQDSNGTTLFHVKLKE
ncbi:MAG: NYN domain-containing protein [Anaerolineae bacterium]|jgi:hypothetical protein|nr:NYN domain-containing protein [Anaerolineae bacterium]